MHRRRLLTAASGKWPRMDVRLLLAAATLVAGGCVQPSETMLAQRWAQGWVDSLNSRNVIQTVALLGDNGIFEDPLSGGPLHGPPVALVQALIWRRFPQLHYELRRATGDGNLVVAEWTATGLGATPVDGVFLIEVHGTAITRVRSYYDFSGIATRGGVQALP